MYKNKSLTILSVYLLCSSVITFSAEIPTKIFYITDCQDRLDPVFNKGQDVSLCESVHRTSTCFRCYPSNQ